MCHQVLAGGLHLLCEVENLQDVLVVLKPYGTEQCRDGQLLLTVDVRIHDVVDVRCELNPASLEGDDAGRVEQRAIGMNTAAEEYARRAVQL